MSIKKGLLKKPLANHKTSDKLFKRIMKIRIINTDIQGGFMDFSTMLAQLHNNLTPFNITILVLLLVSEVLGSNDNIKASSIYGALKAVLKTFVDQVVPVKPTAPVDTTPTNPPTAS